MLVRVGGVPGVGKTTVIHEVQEIARIEGFQLEIAKTRETLCELAGVKTVEEYRALPEQTRSNLYPEMDRRVYESDRQDPSIIRLYDGHFWFFHSQGGLYRARIIHPGDDKQLLAIAVIVADPEVVYNRRLKDLAIRSDRHWVERDGLDWEQRMEVAVASTQAAQLGIPVRIFHNNGGETPKVSELVLSFVKNLTM